MCPISFAFEHCRYFSPLVKHNNIEFMYLPTVCEAVLCSQQVEQNEENINFGAKSHNFCEKCTQARGRGSLYYWLLGSWFTGVYYCMWGQGCIFFLRNKKIFPSPFPKNIPICLKKHPQFVLKKQPLSLWGTEEYTALLYVSDLF